MLGKDESQTETELTAEPDTSVGVGGKNYSCEQKEEYFKVCL